MSPWPGRRRRFFGGGNAASGRPRPYRPVLECLGERCLLSGGYAQINLASDVPGVARVTDPYLVNPWGLSFSPTGPFWFADNGTGVSDLLDGRGRPVPLVVTVAGAAQPGGTPTGTVFNNGLGFVISENGASRPSRFLFATEDGTISGWNSLVDPDRALLAINNSSSGAVYKGLALAVNPAGQRVLYAADFGRGRIDVFDPEFRPIARPGSFQDPNLPDGFAPFNIQAINNLLFVTYAQQDAARRDDIAGEGHGFIDVYDTGGNLVRRFASQGALDSPWGLVRAPADFGPFGGALLVGNNGDGHINAYDPGSGAFLGPLQDGSGIPITIPDLWALAFGNGHEGGASDTLFFTAGADDEEHGLFGAIQAPQRRGADTAGAGTFDPHAPGESGDYPLPPRGGPALRDSDDDSRRATVVLLPLTESSLALIPTLSVTPQPKARVEAVAPATPAVAVPSLGSVGTAQPVSGITLFPDPAGDSPPPENTQNDSLALNAFLDLYAAQSWPENPAGGQGPDTDRDAVGTRRPPSAGDDAGAESPRAEPNIENLEAPTSAEQSPKSPPPSGQTDKALARVRSQDRPESAGDSTAWNEGVETHNRVHWAELLNGLLGAVGIPVIYALCRGLRVRHVSHPGKILGPTRGWSVSGPGGVPLRSAS
jgi:uncharacterized protein (TIGR03118 family)